MIPDVLNQINDLTTNMSTKKRWPFNSTGLIEKPLQTSSGSRNNILKLSINNESNFKYTWNISVNNSKDEIASTSNMSQPSDVNTLERINDLNLVESKLSDLKFGHIETSL